MEDLRQAMQKMQVELDSRPPTACFAAVATHEGKVDMPVFWEEDVNMWFQQVEAGFQRQNVDRERWYDCTKTEPAAQSSKTAVLVSGTGTRP